MLPHPGARHRLVLGFLLALALAPTSAAQTLAFRRYDVPEGLANSRVNSVFQDSRGYLWFGTWEGLSRFDGVEFRSYSTPEGLPNFLVNAVTEDPQGRIWVATQGGGVARLLDRQKSPPGIRTETPRSMFESHAVGDSRESNIVQGILFDRRGDLCCGTQAGIFIGSPGEHGDLRFEPVAGSEVVEWAQPGFVDGRGRLWCATKNAILALEGSRIAARLSLPEPASDLVEPIAIFPRPGGGTIVAFTKGVFELDSSEKADAAARWHRLPVALAPAQDVRCALFDSKGTLWLGTTAGLIRFHQGAQTTYTLENGLPDISISCLCEDRDHDLWVGTWSGGVAKLAGEAIVSFTLAAAMPDHNVHRLVEARDGSIYATAKAGIVRVRGDRVDLVPGSQDPAFAMVGQRILQDRRGDFWIGTIGGLHRFPGPELDLRSGRRFGSADGIDAAEVFGAIHEDQNGRIWVGLSSGSLYAWDPARDESPRFERVAVQDRLSTQAPREYLSDSAGQLWLAPYVGLARIAGDRTDRFEPSEGLPDLQTRCLFEDRDRRVWIGTRFRGVSVTDEPAAARPRFRNYSTRTGLSSDAVWSIAQDDEGRMYFATSRGIEQLDAASGRVRHITTFDGLAGDIVNHLLKDSRGNIWAATSGGISRYDPRAEPPQPDPPPIYLSRIRIAGDDLPISEIGERSVPGVTLPASKDNLLIEFVGLSFRGER